MQDIHTTQVDLYLGDCVEGIKSQIETASIDIVVTSPPYNLGVEYNCYDDHRENEEYLKWTDSWTAQVQRALKEDGSLFLNIGGSPKNPLLPHVLVNRLVRENYFVLQNTIHWIKSIAMPTDDDSERQIGHYKPINSPRFVNDCHEFVFHLTPTGHTELDRKAVGVPYSDKSNIARWAHTGGGDVKCKGNTWFIPYKTISSRAKDRPHPATFPTELATQCIKLHGKNGKSRVMDPFLGIGHAAFAAVDCGVASFVGFEIDPAYLSVASAELITMGVTPNMRAVKPKT